MHPTTPHGRIPRELTLVPGLRLAARGARLLSVVDGEHAVALPDTPAVHRLLRELARGPGGEPGPGWAQLTCTAAAPGTGGAASTAADLAAARAVDVAAAPATDDDPEGLATARALGVLISSGLTQSRTEIEQRATARLEARVLIDAPDRHAGTALELLLESRVGVTTRREQATHALVVGTGEVERGRLEEWARRDVDHLVVADRGTSVSIGPFVSFGRTACVHCVDAHRVHLDPTHAALVCDLAGAEPLTRAVDPGLRAAAVAWAVRDLVTVIDGGRPSTWSATVTLDARAGAGLSSTRRPWRRHPDCGCAWAEVLRAEATG